MKFSLSFLFSNPWRLKLLIFWNVLGILLFSTLFTPGIVKIWDYIDAPLFRFFNYFLRHSSSLRLFWAMANTRLADWFEDLCILGFYCAAVWKTKKEERPRKAAEFIFCVLLTACVILFINRLVCRDYLKLRRASPTLILSDSVYLADFISWIRVKTDSSKSFPSDHATTALMFACSYAYFVRGWLGFLALVYGAFLCLPRLIVGAHWPSDIIVGSGCIVIFALSWVFCTPFANRCIDFIHQKLQKFLSNKTSIHTS